MARETKQEGFGALAREVLEWLADRPSKAFTAGLIADHLEGSVPKVHGALASLRERDAVQHFKGDPGTWSITRRGHSLVKFDTAAEGTRFRMALEAIAELDQSFRSAQTMQKIARRALEGAPDA